MYLQTHYLVNSELNLLLPNVHHHILVHCWSLLMAGSRSDLISGAVKKEERYRSKGIMKSILAEGAQRVSIHHSFSWIYSRASPTLFWYWLHFSEFRWGGVLASLCERNCHLCRVLPAPTRGDPVLCNPILLIKLTLRKPWMEYRVPLWTAIG